jgi:broad specificity phosphatase PhoE
VTVVRYITHPEVVIDPATPVPQWRLSEQGRRRLAAMLAQPWVPSIGRVVSSTEYKAVEAATMLAEHLGLAVEQRAATGEIDRSATGYVPAAEHERLADACFGQPDVSAGGWERAIDAQRRIVAALGDLLDAAATGPDIAVVGHGGVGTLWYCHLTGVPIERRWDQPGQGHYVTVDGTSCRPLHGWLLIDQSLSNASECCCGVAPHETLRCGEPRPRHSIHGRVLGRAVWLR